MKLHSYEVYFDVRAGYSDSDVAEIIRKLGDNEKQVNGMYAYELTKVSDKASFVELYDYCFKAHYTSAESRKDALDAMAPRYTQEPHLSVMKMAGQFKVAFSERILG